MSTIPRLLQLPRELRDEIYYYILDVGGYAYNNMTGKLRSVDDRSIDLALMLVCKDITTEVKELFFKRNAVTVSTGGAGPAHTAAPEASRYGDALLDIRRTKALVLALNASAVSFTAEQAMGLFPDTGKQLFESLTNQRICKCIGSCSVRRPFWHGPISGHFELLEILFQDARSRTVLGSSRDFAVYSTFHTYCTNEERILPALSSPWETPSETQFCAMNSAAELPPRLRSKFKRSYSSVARFRTFVQAISDEARNKICTVILADLHGSVASPECHGRGLIQLCKDHPQLRIERRVDIQNAVLQPHYRKFRGEARIPVIKALLIRVMARWIEEAMALELAGMPPSTFELIFVGTPEAIQTTLDIVKEAAVWHLAFQKHFQDGIIHEENGCPKAGIDPAAAILARYLPGILRGSSCVKFAGCGPDSLWSDVDQLLRKNRNCMAVEDWASEYMKMDGKALPRSIWSLR